MRAPVTQPRRRHAHDLPARRRHQGRVDEPPALAGERGRPVPRRVRRAGRAPAAGADQGLRQGVAAAAAAAGHGREDQAADGLPAQDRRRSSCAYSLNDVTVLATSSTRAASRPTPSACAWPSSPARSNTARSTSTGRSACRSRRSSEAPVGLPLRARHPGPARAGGGAFGARRRARACPRGPGPGGRRRRTGRHRQDEAARRHARAARGRPGCSRCTPAGPSSNASFTFGIVRQLFEPALFAASAEDARPLAVRRGRPDALDVRGRRRRPRAGVELRAPARALLAVREPRRRAPLVVCVDDAQWADEPSLNFVGFLLRRLEDLPVALLLGTRPRAEQESDVLRGSSPTPPRATLRPRRCSHGAVGAWVRAGRRRRRRRRLLRGLPRDDGGNPFLVQRAPARGRSTSGCARPTPRPPPCASSARRRSRRSCCSASSGCPPRRPRWRAPSRSSARAPRRRWRRSSPSSTPPTAEEAARRALPRRRAHARRARPARLRPPDRARGGLPRPARRSRACRRPRGARCTPGAAPEEIASQHRPHRAAPATRGRSRQLRAAAAGRSRSVTRDRRRATSSARWQEPPPTPRAPRSWPSSPTPRRARARPTAGEHFREAIAASRRSATRAARSRSGSPRCLKFRGDSPRAIDVARGCAGGARRRRPGLAEQLEIELVGAAYISLAARPLLAAEIAAHPRPTTAAVDARPPASDGQRRSRRRSPPARRGGRRSVARRALAGGDLPTDVARAGTSTSPPPSC